MQRTNDITKYQTIFSITQPRDATIAIPEPAKRKRMFFSKGTLFSVAFLLLSSHHLQNADAAIGQELVYRVTVRDMLHGECIGSNVEHRQRWTDAWGTNDRPAASTANNCPFTNKLNSGELIPNVDFQAGDYQGGFPLNAGLNITWGAGGGRGSILPIVNETLELQSSGLSKPEYCSLTERCGKPVSSGSLYPATVGFESFQQWYNDDRRTNRRIGAKLILTDTLGDGTFNYDSGSFYNPISDDVPFPPPAETDPDKAQRWDKTKLAANTRQFFITTSINTFFQYRGGEKVSL
jgi:hypothetical protein